MIPRRKRSSMAGRRIKNFRNFSLMFTLLLCVDIADAKGGGGGPMSSSFALPKNFSLREVVLLTLDAAFPLNFRTGSCSVEVCGRPESDPRRRDGGSSSSAWRRVRCSDTSRISWNQFVAFVWSESWSRIVIPSNAVVTSNTLFRFDLSDVHQATFAPFRSTQWSGFVSPPDCIDANVLASLKKRRKVSVRTTWEEVQFFRCFFPFSTNFVLFSGPCFRMMMFTLPIWDKYRKTFLAVTNSVTRLGEISQLWQNLKRFWAIFWMDRLVLGKLSYLPWHCYATVQIVIFENGQRLNNNTATWSHWSLITLH